MSTQLFQIITILIGSLLGSGAAVTLIKFFVERNDNKKKEEKQEQKEAEQDKWGEYKQETENKLNELRDEFKQSLDERETTGKQRYDEHQESINALTDDISKLTELISKNTHTLGLVGESLVGLEHDKIMFLTEHFIKRKCITAKEKATLKALFVPYHKLGGNGDCEAGYNACKTLPVVDDDEAEQLDKALKMKELGLNIDK